MLPVIGDSIAAAPDQLRRVESSRCHTTSFLSLSPTTTSFPSALVLLPHSLVLFVLSMPSAHQPIRNVKNQHSSQHKKKRTPPPHSEDRSSRSHGKRMSGREARRREVLRIWSSSPTPYSAQESPQHESGSDSDDSEEPSAIESFASKLSEALTVSKQQPKYVFTRMLILRIVLYLMVSPCFVSHTKVLECFTDPARAHARGMSPFVSAADILYAGLDEAHENEGTDPSELLLSDRSLIILSFSALVTHLAVPESLCRDPFEVEALRDDFQRLASLTGGTKLIDTVLALDMSDLMAFGDKVRSLSLYGSIFLLVGLPMRMYLVSSTHQSTYVFLILSGTSAAHICALKPQLRILHGHRAAYMRTAVHACHIRDNPHTSVLCLLTSFKRQ